MIRGQQVNAYRAPQFLVDSPPAAESVQSGDALLEAVASGQLVAAVQVGEAGTASEPSRSLSAA